MHNNLLVFGSSVCVSLLQCKTGTCSCWLITLRSCKRKEGTNFMLFSNHNRSLLRQQPGADAAKLYCAVQVKRGAATVGGSAHPPIFEALYDLMGPTYPGLSVLEFVMVLCSSSSSTLDSSTNPTAFIILTTPCNWPCTQFYFASRQCKVKAASTALYGCLVLQHAGVIVYQQCSSPALSIEQAICAPYASCRSGGTCNGWPQETRHFFHCGIQMMSCRL